MSREHWAGKEQNSEKLKLHWQRIKGQICDSLFDLTVDVWELMDKNTDDNGRLEKKMTWNLKEDYKDLPFDRTIREFWAKKKEYVSSMY